MELNAKELDRIVYAIIKDGGSSTAFTREQIAQLVIDDIAPRIAGYILPSLERLVSENQIEVDRDSSRGLPYTYSVPKFIRRF